MSNILKNLANTILRMVLIALFALVLMRTCSISVEKQIEADYQKCLSWKADGYDVYCDEGEYK